MPSGIDLLDEPIAPKSTGMDLLYSFEWGPESEPYRKHVEEAEAKHNIPKGLLPNLIQTESNWNPKAKSKAGAIGLMQIVPSAHPDAKPFDVPKAIDYGASFLADNYKKLGSWEAATAAYNAGVRRVKEQGMNNLPPETSAYVEKLASAKVSGISQVGVTSGLDLLEPPKEQPAEVPTVEPESESKGLKEWLTSPLKPSLSEVPETSKALIPAFASPERPDLGEYLKSVIEEPEDVKGPKREPGIYQDTPSLANKIWRRITRPSPLKIADTTNKLILAEKAGISPSSLDPSVKEIISAGFGDSLPGLIIRDFHKVNFDTMSKEALELMPLEKRALFMASGFVPSFPFMAIGGAVGAAATGGSPVGAMAGAFGLDKGLRALYTNKIENGEINTFGDFWTSVTKSGVETVKGLATGAVTAKVGGAMPDPLTKLGAESVAMTAVGAALEGRVPEPKEVADTALMLAMFHAGGKAVSELTVKSYHKQLLDIYKETGLRPSSVIDLLKGDKELDKKFSEGLTAEVIEKAQAEVDKIEAIQHELAVKEAIKDLDKDTLIKEEQLRQGEREHLEKRVMPIKSTGLKRLTKAQVRKLFGEEEVKVEETKVEPVKVEEPKPPAEDKLIDTSDMSPAELKIFETLAKVEEERLPLTPEETEAVELFYDRRIKELSEEEVDLFMEDYRAGKYTDVDLLTGGKEPEGVKEIRDENLLDDEAYEARKKSYSDPFTQKKMVNNPFGLVEKLKFDVNAWFRGEGKRSIEDIRNDLSTLAAAADEFKNMKVEDVGYLFDREVDWLNWKESVVNAARWARNLDRTKIEPSGGPILYSGIPGDLIFRSVASEINRLKTRFGRMPKAGSLLNQVKRLSDIKQSDLDFIGVTSYLEGKKANEQVSWDDMFKSIRGLPIEKEVLTDRSLGFTESPAKYDPSAYPSLTLGGDIKNYKETLFSQKFKPGESAFVERHFGEAGEGVWATNRTHERSLTSGESTLHCDEVQSVQAERGSVEGFGEFKADPKIAEEMANTQRQLAVIRSVIESLKEGVTPKSYFYDIARPENLEALKKLKVWREEGFPGINEELATKANRGEEARTSMILDLMIKEAESPKLFTSGDYEVVFNNQKYNAADTVTYGDVRRVYTEAVNRYDRSVEDYRPGRELFKSDIVGPLTKLKTKRNDLEERIHQLGAKSEGTGVPDMPFRKDWYKIVMRDAVNEAIALDKDGVSWSTARILAERYNKFADEFRWTKLDLDNFKYEVNFYKDGEVVNGQRLKSLDEIEDFAGKKVRRAIEYQEKHGEEQGIHKGEILVDAEMFQRLYDKQIPEMMKKEYGIKAELRYTVNEKASTGNYPSGIPEDHRLVVEENFEGDYDVYDADGYKKAGEYSENVAAAFVDKAEAEAYAKNRGKKEKIWYAPLSDKLKASHKEPSILTPGPFRDIAKVVSELKGGTKLYSNIPLDEMAKAIYKVARETKNMSKSAFELGRSIFEGDISKEAVEGARALLREDADKLKAEGDWDSFGELGMREQFFNEGLETAEILAGRGPQDKIEKIKKNFGYDITKGGKLELPGIKLYSGVPIDEAIKIGKEIMGKAKKVLSRDELNKLKDLGWTFNRATLNQSDLGNNYNPNRWRLVDMGKGMGKVPLVVDPPTKQGIKLYSGVPEEVFIKSANKVGKYMKKARGMKAFKPLAAAKMLKEEFNRSFVDRSGNIRKELLDTLGEDGYRIIQKMYLSKGASSLAASQLKQMQKEISGDLSVNEKHIRDGLILSMRMIDIASYKTKKQFKHPEGMEPADFIRFRDRFWEKKINEVEDLSPARAAKVAKAAEKYFEWMKRPLKDMLENGLISEKEYEDLVAHNYRRIKLVDIVDKRYGAKIGKHKRTIYDSGVESLSRGRGTDVYEPSSEVMALEVFNRVYGRILNNEANLELLKLAKANKENSFVRTKEGKSDVIPSGWTRLFLYEKGQRKSVWISPEMSKEWIISDPEMKYRTSQVIRWLSGSAVLRTFATGIDWGFALANLPRDIMHAWFAARVFENGEWKSLYNSNLPIYGLQMGRDMSSVFFDAAARKGRYLDYMGEGGGMEFLVHQGRLFQRGRHLEGRLDPIFNFLGYLGETTEIMTRLAIRDRVIRRRAKEYGISVEEARKRKDITTEATFAARDYMDFGQGGGVAKALDNAFPYLNASIQGTRGMFRAIKDNKIEATWKIAQFGLLTTGLYIGMKSMTPETSKALQGDPAMSNNLCVPLGDWTGFEDEHGQMRYLYLKVPLDPSQKFFKTFFETATDQWLGNEVDYDRVVKALQEQSPASVSELPPSVSGTIGYMQNRDFWKHRDIVKEAFKYPQSKEEFTPGQTPEFYVDLGEKTGLSPERVKYLVEELITSGSLWPYLLGKGYDAALGDLPKRQKEMHLAEAISKISIIKRFIGLTNPYNQFKKVIDEAEESHVLERFVENRELDARVEGYLFTGSYDKEDVVDYMKQFDKETHDRMREDFKFQEITRDLSNRSFWLRLRRLAPEPRAEVYLARKEKSSSSDLDQMADEEVIVRRAGGVFTEDFMEEVMRRGGVR